MPSDTAGAVVTGLDQVHGDTVSLKEHVKRVSGFRISAQPITLEVALSMAVSVLCTMWVVLPTLQASCACS